MTVAHLDGCIYHYNSERGYWSVVGCNAGSTTSLTIPGVCVGRGIYEAWGNAFAFGNSYIPGVTFTSGGPWATIAHTTC